MAERGFFGRLLHAVGDNYVQVPTSEVVTAVAPVLDEGEEVVWAARKGFFKKDGLAVTEPADLGGSGRLIVFDTQGISLKKRHKRNKGTEGDKVLYSIYPLNHARSVTYGTSGGLGSLDVEQDQEFGIYFGGDEFYGEFSKESDVARLYRLVNDYMMGRRGQLAQRPYIPLPRKSNDSSGGFVGEIAKTAVNNFTGIPV